jgi:hypothetical protein
MRAGALCHGSGGGGSDSVPRPQRNNPFSSCNLSAFAPISQKRLATSRARVKVIRKVPGGKEALAYLEKGRAKGKLVVQMR